MLKFLSSSIPGFIQAEVSGALTLATEACRRYEAGEIADGEYYPVEAVSDRIRRAGARNSGDQQLPHN